MATEQKTKDSPSALIFDDFNWTKPDPEDMKIDVNLVSSCEPMDSPFSYKQSPNKNEES